MTSNLNRNHKVEGTIVSSIPIETGLSGHDSESTTNSQGYKEQNQLDPEITVLQSLLQSTSISPPLPFSSPTISAIDAEHAKTMQQEKQHRFFQTSPIILSNVGADDMSITGNTNDVDDEIYARSSNKVTAVLQVYSAEQANDFHDSVEAINTTNLFFRKDGAAEDGAIDKNLPTDNNGVVTARHGFIGTRTEADTTNANNTNISSTERKRLFQTTPIMLSNVGADDLSIIGTQSSFMVSNCNSNDVDVHEDAAAAADQNTVNDYNNGDVHGRADPASAIAIGHASTIVQKPDLLDRPALSQLFVDEKQSGTTMRRPPIPKPNKFFETAPIDLTDFSENANSILTSTTGTRVLSSVTTVSSSPRRYSEADALSIMVAEASAGVADFGSSRKTATVLLDGTDTSDRTGCSRHSLAHTVQRRKHSLTHQEASFLEDLIKHGNDIDIQIAYETLLDEDLFFDVATTMNNKDQEPNGEVDKTIIGDDVDENSKKIDSSKITEYYCQRYNQHLQINPMEEDESRRRHTVYASDDILISPKGHRIGSELRQLLLHERRIGDTTMNKKMWLAHESGLAVSTAASRRSVFVRDNSVGSIMSGSVGSKGGEARGQSGVGFPSNRQSMFQNKRNESIFRSRRQLSPLSASNYAASIGSSLGRSIGRNALTLNDSQSDNARVRRRLQRSSFSSINSTSGNNLLRSSLTRSGSGSKPPPIPVVLRRLQSEASIVSDMNRSSNSFGKNVKFAGTVFQSSTSSALRTVSEGRRTSRKLSSSGQTQPPAPIIAREDSTLSASGSVPSIRMAHEIKSPSGSTISTIQPHGRSSFRMSDTSVLSLHMAHEVSSPIGSLASGFSYDPNATITAFPRFPSLRHAHVVRSDIALVDSLTQQENLDDDDTNYINEADQEEKKSDSDGAKIPRKVEILTIDTANTRRTVSSGTGTTISTTELPVILQLPGDTIATGVKQVTALPEQDTAEDDDYLIHRPVLVRRASGAGQGSDEEGIEVADWEIEKESPRAMLYKAVSNSTNETYTSSALLSTTGTEIVGDRPTELTEFDLVDESNSALQCMYRANSFDDCQFLSWDTSNLFNDDGRMNSTNNNNCNSIFRRVIRRSMSDDSVLTTGANSIARFYSSLRNEIRGEDSERDVSASTYYGNDDSKMNMVLDSWRMDDCNDDTLRDEEEDDDAGYDAWKVIEDEYVNGYGGGGTLPFLILGTSANDVDSHPHVLSPPLMESLLSFVPISLAGDNLWMKYSLVRDGASIHTFLQKARGARYSFLAIETIHGEVFGAFTASTWRKNWNYYGNGETFLWKMKKSRRFKAHSIIDQAQIESEIEVYPYTGANHCIQLCTNDRIAIGGSTGGGNLLASIPSAKSTSSKSVITVPPPSSDENKSNDDVTDNDTSGETCSKNLQGWGFGLTIESDLLHGTSSPCFTFGNPSLSVEHSDGSLFEIMNLELWTFTPCSTLEDAEKLELSKLFGYYTNHRFQK